MALVFQSDAQETGRPKNTIYYATPAMGGFGAAVSYSLNEKAAAVAAVPATVTPAVAAGLEVTSFNVNYAGGPLYATVGYQAEKAYGTATEVKITQVNVTYDLGVVTLLGALGSVSNSNFVSGDKASEWLIGVNVPVSAALTASAGYASSTSTFASGAADSKHTAFSMGGAYSLSKRTTAYAALSSDKVDTTDVTTNKYAVGVIHKF
jgi:predicted porin